MPLDPRLRSWIWEPEEPSLRYRVLTELEGRTPDDPAVEPIGREIGVKGWAEEILDRQFSDGHWSTPGASARELYVPKYIVTNWQLIVLSDLGLPRGDPRVARSLELLWDREGGPEGGLGGTTSEVCFTGNALRYMVRLGDPKDPRLDRLIGWLLGAQKADGGWHCFDSPVGTLDGWEALAAFAALPRSQWTSEIRRSVERGAEFYLERELLHEGPTPYAPWFRLHYPVHYYYDVLVGLDMLTRLGYGADPRLRPALDLLRSKRNADGSWNLEAVHPDVDPAAGYTPKTPIYPYALELPGQPSRWITVTALAVLARTGAL